MLDDSGVSIYFVLCGRAAFIRPDSLLSLFLKRQLYREARPLAFLALDLDRASVRIDYPFRYRQPQPETADPRVAWIRLAVESLENMRERRSGNAAAGIRNLDQCKRIYHRERKPGAASCRRVLDRVIEEIHQQLL